MEQKALSAAPEDHFQISLRFKWLNWLHNLELLFREIKRLELIESCCPECGGELDYLGNVRTEQLELVSPALKVIRTELVKKPVQNVTVSLKRRPVSYDWAGFRGARVACPSVNGEI